MARYSGSAPTDSAPSVATPQFHVDALRLVTCGVGCALGWPPAEMQGNSAAQAGPTRAIESGAGRSVSPDRVHTRPARADNMIGCERGKIKTQHTASALKMSLPGAKGTTQTGAACHDDGSPRLRLLQLTVGLFP